MDANYLMEVSGVGKAYSRYRSEWHRVASWFMPVKASQQTWILQHINFSVRPGEALGIVGQNGAGKSTLLKMITGTLAPTHGRIEVRGRIAAILELGMGFNPEFSGRHNARYTASLMGFDAEQIDAMMPRVEEFAEIGDYFDKPVRTYSSGMQMRVAFAVATAERPDVLIVDEALSVGDSYFQHKSYDRIREFQAQGTSLLLVSHDPSLVQGLCDRAVLLEKGAIIKDGPPGDVMDYYNALIAEKENSSVEIRSTEDGKSQTISGSGEARISEAGLFNLQNKPIEYVRVDEEVELRARVSINSSLPSLVFGYLIKDRLGQHVFGTNTWHQHQVIENAREGEVIDYSIAFPVKLGPGSYSISLSVHADDSHVSANYHWWDHAVVFDVVNERHPYFIGVCHLPTTIKAQRHTP
ncbi:ABC transporter ATP-binding protein [Halomonas sp. HMF6819]|uniref:ABC transporter ATP-binding protein n=1 Tax=Halomonas sp. HMF6819 TaxID=3373085 RepID=UPI003789F3C8